MQFPHFDFYVRDWLNDLNNRALTREARSVHIDLLAMMWQQDDCRLPDNDRAIAALLGARPEEWQTWRADLIDGPLPVLRVEDGFIISPRLMEERNHAVEVSTSKRNNANNRWGKQKNSVGNSSAYANASSSAPANANQTDMQNGCEPDAIHLSPNTLHQVPKDQEIKHDASSAVASVYSPEFETFWGIYPRREGKRAAWRAWQARLKQHVQPAMLIRAATHYAAYCTAQHTESRFVKQAKTFLGPDAPYDDWVTLRVEPNPVVRENPTRASPQVSDNQSVIERFRARVTAEEEMG